MITYDIFKKENHLEILKIAKEFDIPDRKGKRQEARIIVMEKFENKEKGNENTEENKEEILKGLVFEKFSIESIRKNPARIIFCNITNSKDSKILNELAKYNEIDVIIANEIMDKVVFKNMNKNFISLAFGFSEILNCWGMQRVKKLAIMKKNFQMVKKYGINYIVSTFASNIFEYKPAETLMAFGKILGMSDDESRNAVSKNFENILKKFNDRNDENLLTDGLRVLKFGDVKKEKKKYGYY
ncbi:MAG: RNase P subunit p30 family protein [Candidatus Altarchaeum sp.]|nr:RNase P subunit p30 family protein [Candidatus Altarchaeum sp.]